MGAERSGEERWGGRARAQHLFLQVKLLELQELVLHLVDERNEWQGKFLATAQNPAGEATTAPPAQELGAVDGQGGE